MCFHSCNFKEKGGMDGCKALLWSLGGKRGKGYIRGVWGKRWLGNKEEVVEGREGAQP